MRHSDVTDANRQRWRAILLSRQVKAVFCAVPERCSWILEKPAKWSLRAWFLRPILRWLFLSQKDGKPHRAGEAVLAHWRRKAGYNRPTNFDPDPHLMAFSEGVRANVQDLFTLLNLDESDVQNLMELDDGLDERK